MRRRILLYAPELIGHPRIYCRVIADALEGTPCDVYIALGVNDEVGVHNSPDLQPLLSREHVTLLDTRDLSPTRHPFLRIEDLRTLQARLDIHTTVFIEADKSAEEFRRIAAGVTDRLIGRNLGVFAKTAEWYPGENSFTGIPKTLLVPSLRRTLGNLKRAVLHRRHTPRYFYKRLILGARVLDTIIVKDERLARQFGDRICWMPEMSRPAKTPERPSDLIIYDRIRTEYEVFLEANRHREPVLYFGDAAYYKGYDLFLEYLRREPEVCGVHAGHTYDAVQRSYFEHDVEALRRCLRNEGRLFETNCYVHTQRLKELFFGSISRYLTTHRLTLSSSTCLQALEMGVPLLVPDQGLLAHRVRANGLGRTYRYLDMDHLVTTAAQFRNEDSRRYAASIQRFNAYFTDEAIRTFWTRILLDRPGTTKLPLVA